MIEHIVKFDNLKKAAAFFVFNRITFSGTSESGGFSNAAFKKRFTQSSIERVRALSTILDNTLITNLNYQKVVEAKGKNVFIFLDPPYYSATKSALYGKNGKLHKSFDHEKFAQILKDVSHKWLITYDDSEYIRDLFSFAYIKEWYLTYGMRNVGKNSNQNGKELFISNYPIIEKKVYIEGVKEYRVKPGDTLSKISREFNVSVNDLAEFNHIADPDNIKVGMLLQIPPASMQQVKYTPITKDENVITHKVERGETLWDISRLYGVEVDVIKEVNNLDGFHIKEGQIINIPLK